MQNEISSANGKALVIPQGTTSVQREQFSTKAIEVVVIPSSVVEIHASAFKDCTSLREVIFTADSHLASIGIAAFYNSRLTSFTAPPSLRKICQAAFYECKTLK